MFLGVVEDSLQRILSSLHFANKAAIGCMMTLEL